jgi:hypothetical protein
MTKEMIDGLKACQKARWRIVCILGSVALAAAGGIVGVLLLIRGDVSYTKGQVDLLVNLRQATAGNTASPLVAKTDKQKGDGNGIDP